MHNDYKSRSNRLASSRLVIQKMEPFLADNIPVILLGDFNALRFFKAVSMFRPEGFSIAKTKGSSFHFNRGLNLYPAIDHILFSEQFRQEGFEILRRSYNGIYPSDHYPVSVRLDWKSTAAPEAGTRE
jgi:endonuclease/exonuclease/phosphatase family metal-dependent hydrolase